MKNMQTHIFINKYKGDVVVKPKTNHKLYFDLAFYQAIMLMNYLTLLFRSIEDISRPLSTFIFIALIIASDVIGIKVF